MQKFTFDLKKLVFCLFGFVFLTLFGFVGPADSRAFIHGWLNRYYNKEGQLEPLKRYELNVTNNGFCRFRKVYANGKEEFFSFNLSRFSYMDYYGDTNGGELWLRTKNDDVIVQTRNDKRGDVDSMSTYMVVPIKDIDEDKLNELATHLRQLTQGSLVANK